MADVVFPPRRRGASPRADGDQLRAPRAARAQGDRPARARRATTSGSSASSPRRLGHDWGQPTPSRCGTSCARSARCTRGMSYARLEELGGHPVAVPGRGASGLAVPARPPVGASRSAARARRSPVEHCAAGRRARRRVPDPADHRPAPRLLQHRRAVGPLPLAAAPRRDARPVRRRTPSASASSRGEIVRVTSRRGSVEAPVRFDPALRPGLAVHDHALPRRGRRQRADHRRDRPEVGHGGVQGDGDPDREGARASNCRRDQQRGRSK